ncbi:cation:proton antiporter [Thermotoga sp. KOL6]|uniref:cation:proton antiporter n=1 Tax=Thermotoga sp. KOL6 TaxID=126741 RepID=UPI000C7574FE|nr:cation:proton antiporter [Thermotoga sp. KOL6]PLV59842.1 cation:proton antiporter [Thermotoga sp. KOL6]
MIFLYYNFFLISLGIVCLSLKKKVPKWITFVNLSFVLGIILFNYRFDITFTGEFGVHLLLDQTSRYFLLLSALVFTAVFMKGMSSTLSGLSSILLGILNLAFVSYDLFNIYVVVEAVSLVTFLMIVEGKRKIQYWSAFKYLVIGTVGMNLFLIGVAILYSENGTLSISDISRVSPLASSLILVGLLLRSGVFLFSMWLPQVHAESETVVSALLSGVVVKSTVYGLLRVQNIVNWQVVKDLALFSAIFGAVLVFLSKDYKRMLAYSTLSQVGIILVSPITAPVYALAHGISKAWLFLLKDDLPGRDVTKWKKISFQVWFFLAIATLSIMGLPGFAGFVKILVLDQLQSWEKFVLELAFIGTAASFWRLLLKTPDFSKQKFLGFYNLVLLVSSVLVGISYAEWNESFETILSMGIGFLIHLGFNRYKIDKYPLEDFEAMMGSYFLGVVIVCLLSLQL